MGDGRVQGKCVQEKFSRCFQEKGKGRGRKKGSGREGGGREGEGEGEGRGARGWKGGVQKKGRKRVQWGEGGSWEGRGFKGEGGVSDGGGSGAFRVGGVGALPKKAQANSGQNLKNSRWGQTDVGADWGNQNSPYSCEHVASLFTAYACFLRLNKPASPAVRKSIKCLMCSGV